MSRDDHKRCEGCIVNNDGCHHDIEAIPSTCSGHPPLFDTHQLHKTQPQILSPGSPKGTLLLGKTPLSFWGGTDPKTGRIIDTHHDLHNSYMRGRILGLPSARGSCSGSLALLECIVAGNGPAGIVLSQPDHIIALGALVANVLFGKPVPIVVVGERYNQLQDGAEVRIDTVHSTIRFKNSDRSVIHVNLHQIDDKPVNLTSEDQAMLDGSRGEGLQKAMELVITMGKMYGARRLIDVSHAHIDACIYVGPASLEFAQKFLSLGVKFSIPTTLNSVSVDQRRWERLGVDPVEAKKACDLAETYRQMGASDTSFTCAPYLLPDHPQQGDQIVWGESNAVVFANSVLDARTQKYPDMLDVLVALTGRAPEAGPHLDDFRVPTVGVNVDARLAQVEDELMWPLLGYRIGAEAGSDIVIVYGLERTDPTMDDLKAFSAAYGTSSGSPMFHIHGVTPQARGRNYSEHIRRKVDITRGDLLATWKELNTARTTKNTKVDLVALGNPHLSIDEMARIALFMTNRTRSVQTSIILTCGRYTEEKARKAGYLDTILAFGALVLTDTCWCMIDRPIIADNMETIMTNSAKYAHYGPGQNGRKIHFGNLRDCIEAAVSGRNPSLEPPFWLTS